MKTKNRVLSGYRPSGKLHLGHYFGNLMNMIELQEKYESFFFIADWHALTTEYANPKEILKSTNDMVLDWLAAGLDPNKATIYRQSEFPEIAELTLYFGMITPLPWLERCPTYKEQLREIKGRDLTTFGFLGYPVLMTADILSVKGEMVPVGEDQLPHLELAREITRRFNNFYGEFFPEPKALLSESKRVPGIDGRKMSKSYNNAINLTDSSDEIRKKIQQMITDPKRIHLSDRGHPEVCTVFALHQSFNPNNITDIEDKCKNAVRGCVECKKMLAEAVIDSLSGFQKKRKELEKDKEIVKRILNDGAEKAGFVIRDCLEGVRERISLKLV